MTNTMTTNEQRETARIYQFPPRGRFAAAREESRTKEHVPAPRVASVAFGSGWYHDEAIQEAERARRS